MRARGILYILIIYIIMESILRIGFGLARGVSMLMPGDVMYSYYPMLRAIRDSYTHCDHHSYKVLILSCSTLHKEWGDFENILRNDLATDTNPQSGGQHYAVFNAAGIGFSSRDNLNCLRLLSDLNFDLVVDYSGINDARLNNCPQRIYKDDYSHMAWNNEINCILRHREINITIIPFLIDYSYQLFYEAVCRGRFIPVHYSMRPDWWSYGSDMKSLLAFHKNIQAIEALCRERREQLLLIPYCYYIPADYSLQRFKDRQLDYAFQPKSREIEIWGRPASVAAFLDSADAIITAIAIRDGISYLDVRPSLRRHDYFADICHYSGPGLSAFAAITAQKIREISQRDTLH